jgi:hypothetical protein
VLPQRVKRLRKIFFGVFYADRLSPGIDYTERRKTKRKRIRPESKFIRIFLKESFHKEEKV